MASRDLPTFGQLLHYLEGLDFHEETGHPGLQVWRHARSDTWMVFADRSVDGTARQAELVFTRKQLIERGLATEQEFDQFLSTAVHGREPKRT